IRHRAHDVVGNRAKILRLPNERAGPQLGPRARVVELRRGGHLTVLLAKRPGYQKPYAEVSRHGAKVRAVETVSVPVRGAPSDDLHAGHASHRRQDLVSNTVAAI